MVHLFKRILDTFQNFEMNFRDIRMDFGDNCSNIFRDIGDPPSRATVMHPPKSYTQWQQRRL